MFTSLRSLLPFFPLFRPLSPSAGTAVVITIIGILLAMLIPAVNMVLEMSRQSTCSNNQRQIAKAILNYEVTKNHLPGVLSKTSSGVVYSWVEAITPNWIEVTYGK